MDASTDESNLSSKQQVATIESHLMNAATDLAHQQNMGININELSPDFKSLTDAIREMRLELNGA